MAIEPNSTIHLFGDLGLKPNQEDTIYFANETAKTNWFNNRPVLASFSAQYYTRRNRGIIRVAPPSHIGQVYNAQYMRFKNTSYENKWFYAFITSVDYINDTVVEIKYEIDVMMTWMGDFNLLPCYVVRQHVGNDGIGYNTVDENVDLGQYVCEATSRTAFFNTYYIGVWWDYDPSHDAGQANFLRQGAYTPLMCGYFSMDASGLSSLERLLFIDLPAQNRPDAVLNMKLVPYYFAVSLDPSDPDPTTPIYGTHTISKPYSNFLGNNNYKPKNKKLYTYPYKYLCVENCEGSSITLKYEYFNTVPPVVDNNVCEFRVRGTAVTPEVSIMCIPHNYMNKTWDYSNACEMTKFPNCAWNEDMYKAYLSQRDSTLVGDIAGSAVMGGASGLLMSGFNPLGAIGGALSGGLGGLAKTGLVGDVMNELAGKSQYIMPNETRGKANSDIMVQSKTKDFYFRSMCITPEKMRIIDDFFTMYGYAIKRIQTPQMYLSNRNYFVYVKTIGCNIEPKEGMSIPASDASEIEDMFNAGKRFWRSTAKVGDYSQDNSIS